ncbi:MAG: ribonuclease Y [Clostridia bacterium]|nr:ribonuclease Y [Clostridia bacterium]MBP5657194.1 ribonuclease Y [Clostridia bacterium]MBP5755140.1 ribonuclease Y [Clostridia bacterium]MBQ6043304.1 ribonuclease Y [Clostridia bacterium]
MNPLVCVLIALGAAIVAGTAAFFAGIAYRKKIGEKLIKSAEVEAKRIVNDAERTAETKKKESLVEAKEEAIRIKNETEKELKERRNDIQRMEKRVLQKEEHLDNKIEALDKKEEKLNAKIKQNEELQQQYEETRQKQLEELQRISGVSAEEAKAELLARVEVEARHEMAQKLSDIEKEYKETADEKAKDIITLAIQRCASDSVAEATVSVVDLPNDEMKGRIIGREGRNIRSIETLTGVDLIIDDTPEAITISTFDPIRREVARLTLEKLISDGRIHPSRIEEMVEKSKKEVEAVIKREGEQATFAVGVHGINPELVKLLGRLKYRTSYGQNVLKHSIEVAQIAGMIASELGLDVTQAKRAGLLHDIGKAMTHEVDGSHVAIGVDIARKYKESKEIIHAIEAHHGDVEPKTYVAVIVQAADAISAARPGARRENLENYIKRLQKLEEIANSFEGIEKSFAIQAGREIRIMVKPEEISDDKMIFVAKDIAKKIESELEYPGQIKINMIRETRAFDYAK